MINLGKLMILFSIVAATGCVVAPYGYHRGYYESRRVEVVAPVPVLVVRPYYR